MKIEPASDAQKIAVVLAIRRRKQGVCEGCGSVEIVTVTDTLLCEVCLERKRERDRVRDARRYAEKRDGACSQLGCDRDAAPGMSLCPHCRPVVNDRVARNQRERIAAGLCRVLGCGRPRVSKHRCAEHAAKQTADSAKRRQRQVDKAFANGAEWGAGWAFAIIGMAQAIRDREVCASCGVGVYHRTWLPALCPRCYGV